MASIENHVMADKWKGISETCREREHTQRNSTAAFRFWYVRLFTLHTNLLLLAVQILASDCRQNYALAELSCSRHGVVAARLTSERPDSVTPVSKTFTRLGVYS